MAAAEQTITSPMWRALATSSDIGVYVQDWPTGDETAWAFDGCVSPPMLGLTQVTGAQQYLNDQLSNENPLDGFEDAGMLAEVVSDLDRNSWSGYS